MKNEQARSVLIFGGAGFIGSNLARHMLLRTEAKVHIFDNLSRTGVHHNVEWLRKLAPHRDRLQVTVGDIRDAQLVEKAVSAATEIYHLAAQVAVTTSIADPRLDLEVNVGGAFNVLDAARRCGHRPFLLFTSTNKVYGNLGLPEPIVTPTRYDYPGCPGISESQPLDFHSPYGCSKGAADQYVHDFARIYGLPTVVFRMSCIAGPRQFGTEDQGWVAHFLYSALQRSPVMIYGDGRQVRDVLCIHDLIQAFEATRRHAAATSGQIYNVGGGSAHCVSLLELIDEIERLIGHRLEYELGERRPGDQPFYVSDFSKLHRDTGWKPETGIRETLDLLQKFWEENCGLIPVRAPAASGAFSAAAKLSGRAG